MKAASCSSKPALSLNTKIALGLRVVQTRSFSCEVSLRVSKLNPTPQTRYHTPTSTSTSTHIPTPCHLHFLAPATRGSVHPCVMHPHLVKAGSSCSSFLACASSLDCRSASNSSICNQASRQHKLRRVRLMTHTRDAHTRTIHRLQDDNKDHACQAQEQDVHRCSMAMETIDRNYNIMHEL